MTKRIIAILVIIFIMFAYSLSLVFPENPNYNYITLNVGTSGLNFTQNGSVDFHIDATGYTHNFTVTSTCSDSNLIVGLEVVFTGLPDNFTFVNQSFIDQCVMPNVSKMVVCYSFPVTLTNENPNLTVKWNEIPIMNGSGQNSTSSAPTGYYVFYLANLSGMGRYHDVIKINYQNNYFLIK
ncbi:hypothetical protein ACNF40_05315 [Cuniculiplasma sp. SKW4]|uniref:hypothetical protein n=1 Tax=Cuniculiplasma sp. SKW4 TaxID=3400171 RepID=UPI003FD6426C